MGSMGPGLVSDRHGYWKKALIMFRRAKDRAKDKFYRGARVFITVAKEDARAMRIQNSHRAWDRLEESLGHEVVYPMKMIRRFGYLYRKTYWNTLHREYGSITFLRMLREDKYSRMGAYQQIARDVDELRQTINRIEQQMKEEEIS